MKMKKWLSAVLALVMIMSLSACGSKEEVSGKSLYDHGLDVVSLMVEATRSEAYVEIYTGSDAIMEVLQGIGEGDFTSPKAVYSITADDEVILGTANLGNLDGVSEDLQSALVSKVYGTLITQLNGLSGVEKLAASSVCTMGKTFVDNSVTDNVIYLYTYENALPVAVTFTVGEGGAVSAGGTFIMYEEFTCGSAEEIKAFFSEFDVEVNEMTVK